MQWYQLVSRVTVEWRGMFSGVLVIVPLLSLHGRVENGLVELKDFLLLVSDTPGLFNTTDSVTCSIREEESPTSPDLTIAAGSLHILAGIIITATARFIITYVQNRKKAKIQEAYSKNQASNVSNPTSTEADIPQTSSEPSILPVFNMK